jgi:HTH-type transcriptional regulator/antitoxin HigA
MTVNPKDLRSPGQLIDALIKERGWTQRVLAVVLEMDEAGISRLVSDKSPLDAKLALALEDLFGVPAEQFLDLQNAYDLACARITTRPDPERATRAHLFGGLPVADMIKRGWIGGEDIKDVDTVRSELIRFFRVNQIDDIEILPHAAKKTQVNTEPTPVQLAWLYRVKQIAAEMLVARYVPAALPDVVAQLKILLASPEDTRKVPRILAEAGIRFLIVEALPSSKIDGVCFWLNDASPVVALSMRFDRIDNFWFVLRHEIEHVNQRHGLAKMMLDTALEGEKAGTGGNVDEEERVANEAAAEFCVPAKMLDAFIARKAPFFNEADIKAFAKMIKVHPGLIAGQLRRRLNRYDRFGNHLVKVRSIIAPNAITDGWGNVAPLGN